MIKLKDLVPLNLASEKEKFFASGFSYNPQFIYEKKIDPKELTKYGKPRFWYLFLAKRILKKYLKNQLTIDSVNKKEELLKESEIEEIIKQRLGFYGLENEYEVAFSEKLISRILVNNNEKIIKVLLPITIGLQEIDGILSHEIDTHVLRQFNYEQQPWFKQKKKYGFRPYLRTEEGLAIINELISSNSQLAYKSAINYLAVDLALKNDFKNVFNFFYQINHDIERSWTWTLKKKRGLTDTSQRGAFTKDVVYFEGLINVLLYLLKNNYNPSKIYYGKISYMDVKRAEKIGIAKELSLPQIFSKNPQAYMQNIKNLLKSNLF